MLRIDVKTGSIDLDLGKNHLSNDLLDEAERRWIKTERVHSIIKKVSDSLKLSTEYIYRQWGWDLYQAQGFDHALDALIFAQLNPDSVFKKINIPSTHRIVLVGIVSIELQQELCPMSRALERFGQSNLSEWPQFPL